MPVDETLEIENYEVGYSKNEIIHNTLITSNYHEAILEYNKLIGMYRNDWKQNFIVDHFVIYLFNVGSQYNEKYYDNAYDL